MAKLKVQITDNMNKELDRLKDVCGASAVQIFSCAMTLFRLHVQEAQRGNEISISYPDGSKGIITLPDSVRPSKDNENPAGDGDE